MFVDKEGDVVVRHLPSAMLSFSLPRAADPTFADAVAISSRSVFFVAPGHRIVCADSRTGRLVWRSAPVSSDSGPSCSMTLERSYTRPATRCTSLVTTAWSASASRIESSVGAMSRSSVQTRNRGGSPMTESSRRLAISTVCTLRTLGMGTSSSIELLVAWGSRAACMRRSVRSSFRARTTTQCRPNCLFCNRRDDRAVERDEGQRCRRRRLTPPDDAKRRRERYARS
jgi:hypothetical protein